MKRCDWVGNDNLMIKYHDNVWCRPEKRDRKIFEFLLLETFQAGLSWKIILYKRENFTKAYDNFDYKKIASYGELRQNKLLQNAGIIRNRLKIKASIQNAKAFIKVRNEFGTFSKYIWGFVENKPIQNKIKNPKERKAFTLLSDKISIDMKRRGFKFCGSTVVYSFMQAIGMVNDHLVDCFCYRELNLKSR